MSNQSFYSGTPGLKEGILLEIGFDKTAPKQPRLITSWSYEYAARQKSQSFIDNRAIDVLCYEPKFTVYHSPRRIDAPSVSPVFGYLSWLKAIRGALGINTRQLAARLGLEHAAILQFEKREAAGTVSLESIQKVAQAMRCRFVYAIIPDAPFMSLDAIVDDQSLQAAQEIVEKVDHTMRLEQQGVSSHQSNAHAKEIAQQLKDSMDPMLWGTPREIVRRKKRK